MSWGQGNVREACSGQGVPVWLPRDWGCPRWAMPLNRSSPREQGTALRPALSQNSPDKWVSVREERSTVEWVGMGVGGQQGHRCREAVLWSTQLSSGHRALFLGAAPPPGGSLFFLHGHLSCGSCQSLPTPPPSVSARFFLAFPTSYPLLTPLPGY